MMDYSKMSDFEINRAVAIAKGFHPDDCDIAKRGESMVGVEWDDDTGYATKSFDYCNNPADAWPIMIDDNIGLEKEFSFCCSECSEYYDTGLWEASTPDAEYHCVHKNPLRAAMIVFLMMQESK